MYDRKHDQKAGRHQDLRSSIQSKFARSSADDVGSISARFALLAQLDIVGQLLRTGRVDHHNLTLLAMGSGSTVQEHGVRARNGHVESSDICLAVLEGDVTAVNTAFHRSACCVGGRLRDGVVAVGELELDNVADCCGDGVGDESILGTADDYGDDLAGAAKWVGSCLVSRE